MFYLQNRCDQYVSLKTEQPVYLRFCVTCFIIINQLAARTLRSSSQVLLYQPAARINFQSKASSITARTVWSSLPPVTKRSTSITTFNAHLKTVLCRIRYGLTFLLLLAPLIQTLRHTAPTAADYKCFWHLTLMLRANTFFRACFIVVQWNYMLTHDTAVQCYALQWTESDNGISSQQQQRNLFHEHFWQWSEGITTICIYCNLL